MAKKKPAKTMVDGVSDVSQTQVDAAFPEPFPTKAPDGRAAESEMDAGSASSQVASDSPLATAENEMGAEPFPTETTRKSEADSQGSGEANSGRATDGLDATQTTAEKGKEKTGDDRVSADSAVDSVAKILPSTRAERLPGEGRAVCWERLRKMARAAGMPRGQGPGTAYQWANDQCDRLFSPSEPVPILPTVGTMPEPEFPAIAVSPGPAKQDDGSVSGLSDLPPSWPELPANAQLQVEIAWVTANRLRVRDGTGVNLSKALSPAPSYSALSWLETSILFPAKFADISVKATAQQDDEREFVRREKMAIEEIRSILSEMLDAKG